MGVRLITIPISHYCEKARWSLDRAGIAYTEERHVQGVSIFAARRAGGTETTPVLVDGSTVLSSSEDIVRWADASLFDGPDEIVTLAREFDEGLGPAGRRLMYAHTLRSPKLMLAFNNQGVPDWEARFLRLTFPFAGWVVRKRLAMSAEPSPEDEALCLSVFDDVAARLSDGRPYLVGERFTAADLTFAALAAPLVVPWRYGVRLPQPDVLPPGVAELVKRFRAHPAGQFALRMTVSERDATD